MVRKLINDFFDERQNLFFSKINEVLSGYIEKQDHNFMELKDSIDGLDPSRTDDDGRTTDFYKFMESFARERYDREISRERNIIDQAAHIQTAYSIFLVALLSSVEPVTQYRGEVDLKVFLVGYISIGIIIAVGLLCITKAQQLYRHKELTDIKLITKIIDDKDNEYENLYAIENQCEAKARLYIDIAGSMRENNDKRVKFYNVARILFYITIFISIVLAISGVVYYFNA